MEKKKGRPPISPDDVKVSLTIRLRPKDIELLKRHGGAVKALEEIAIPVLKVRESKP